MLVEPHNVHFPKKVAEDHEWTALCGERGWIGLSRDKQMSWMDITVRTIMTMNVKAFVCIGKHHHDHFAENLINSRHKLEQYVRKYREPFIARLYMTSEEERRRGKPGEIKVWLTQKQWLDLERRRAAG